MAQYIVLPLLAKTAGENAAVLNYALVEADTPELAWQSYINSQETAYGSLKDLIHGKQVIVAPFTSAKSFLYVITFNGYTATKVP